MIEKTIAAYYYIIGGIGGLLTADRVFLMLPQGMLPDFARIGFFGVTVGPFSLLVGGLLGALLGYICHLVERLFGVIRFGWKPS